MGARVYNPNTGRFLTTDPIPGGNPNTYTYPPDPVNGQDLDGQAGKLEMGACAAIGPLCYNAWTITNYVTKREGRDNEKGNARRHFVWNFMLMAQIGRVNTYIVTRSHEGRGAGDFESKVDRRNNLLVQRTQWRNASSVGFFKKYRLDVLYQTALGNFNQAWNGDMSIRSFSCRGNGKPRNCRPGDR